MARDLEIKLLRDTTVQLWVGNLKRLNGTYAQFRSMRIQKNINHKKKKNNINNNVTTTVRASGVAV